LDKFYNNSYRLPGVFINMLPKRFYPFGEEGAHLLGYVGYPTQEHIAEIQRKNILSESGGKAGLGKGF
jgi:penicillin-binding protein 2